MRGTGTYRLSVDSQGAVTHVAILKGFTITAVYDDRFASSKGNPVPALDKVMLQALSHWRAKPGQARVVDIYWSFGMPGVGDAGHAAILSLNFCFSNDVSSGQTDL
jgi:hypothetical protein